MYCRSINRLTASPPPPFSFFFSFPWAARVEGVRALYRGFLPDCVGLIASQLYITSFEVLRVRSAAVIEHEFLRNLMAGGLASLTSQTLMVRVRHSVNEPHYPTGIQLSRGPGGVLSSQEPASNPSVIYADVSASSLHFYTTFEYFI